MTAVMLGARKPRADVVHFLLSTGLEQSTDKDGDVISLETLVHHYMLFGPEHSGRYPFASEEDLASALIWLQRNGYLFLAGDDSVTMNRARGLTSPSTARALCAALEGAVTRLSLEVTTRFA